MGSALRSPRYKTRGHFINIKSVAVFGLQVNEQQCAVEHRHHGQMGIAGGEGFVPPLSQVHPDNGHKNKHVRYENTRHEDSKLQPEKIKIISSNSCISEQNIVIRGKQSQ